MQRLDGAVRSMVGEAFTQATIVSHEKRGILDENAKKLLKKGTLGAYVLKHLVESIESTVSLDVAARIGRVT